MVPLIALLPERFPGRWRRRTFATTSRAALTAVRSARGVHSLVAARLGDAAMALRYLRKGAASDLDLDPNSVGGVHIAGLGALWQAVMLSFAGLDLMGDTLGIALMGDTLGIAPKLPPQWLSLSFRVCWRGRSVAIRIAGRTVQATLVEGEAMEMRIAGATRKLRPGATMRVSV